ncbi:MAG TPA: hypothetical protein VK588_02190 [Chitinophagaceae bacterium]|nr:hypothetical protein [Chitinophagaceae bacterium]
MDNSLFINDNFNEEQWLRLLFLLSDTQTWLDDMAKDFFSHLPIPEKKKFFRKAYYLTPSSLAHIIERHYYKIARFPNASKFHIPVTEILYYIREASVLPASPVPWCLNFQRTIHAKQPVGIDNNGHSSNVITILTDGGGKIVTAYPGQPPVLSES